MEIQSLASGSYAPTAGAASTSPLLQGALGLISQQLGMDEPQMQAAVGKGTSLDDLAARQGVSSSDLQTAVVVHITQSRQAAGQAPIEQDTLQRMVARAFAQGRRPTGAEGAAPAVSRDPVSVYGSSGRLVTEPALAGISILA